MTIAHQKLLTAFAQYLQVLGYTCAKALARSLHEFFDYIEQQGKQFTQISPADLKNYYQYLRHRPNQRDGGALSLRTVDGYIFALKLLFDFAHKTNRIPLNPMSTLRFTHTLTESRFALTKIQIKVLYEVCENVQERAILALFYGCGLRRKEGVLLNVRDIDYRNSWLYVRSGKENKRRVLPLTKGVSEDLKNYYQNYRSTQFTRWTKPNDKKAFMLNANGQRMRGGSYWVYFKRILKRTKLPQNSSLHHLRHSIATHLLESGMSVEQVRDFLGHQCLESTQIYTHVNVQQL